MPLPTVPSCPSRARCGWTHHGYKHFWRKGLTRADTRRGPALYAPEFRDAGVRLLETATVGRAGGSTAAEPAGKTEYLRDAGSIVGWDRGLDAQLSYVECSGGGAGRTFHGRPMSDENPTAERMRQVRR